MLLSHFKENEVLVEGPINNLKQSSFVLSKPRKLVGDLRDPLSLVAVTPRENSRRRGNERQPRSGGLKSPQAAPRGASGGSQTWAPTSQSFSDRPGYDMSQVFSTTLWDLTLS
jgi:hypothetical protein